jgi:hypothetical protein
MQDESTHVTDLISIADAAHTASVGASTIYRWCAAGRLALYKRGCRAFVRRTDLARVLTPRCVRPGIGDAKLNAD